MKAKKTRLFDEQMAKRLHDEEVEQAAAMEKQEKDDLEKAKVLQQQYVDKKENINWNNMAGYKMEHFKGMTYEKKSFKKLKAVEVSGSYSTQDTLTHDPKEISEEDDKNMFEIVPVFEFKVEALQVKYPLIDWEIHYERLRSHWKIIRVGGITKAYQSIKDMLKGFDREDLDALWRLVKEKFSSAVPIINKEKALWIELKRHDMFMLTEKNYPLTNGVMTLMLSEKLQVEEDSDMARDLVMKIFMEANKPRSRSLDTSSK
uniref:Uncharacterized protein n=1 Tax=Tanacetum cinerariifolium TaxID=118510 RepID=A0A699JQK4_TANCI|nr:hypothetical protein [Tanacetum cinerariifolium]